MPASSSAERVVRRPTTQSLCYLPNGSRITSRAPRPTLPLNKACSYDPLLVQMKMPKKILSFLEQLGDEFLQLD